MAGKLSDISFGNSSKNREYNIFTPEFYGGSDARVYIDGKIYNNISSVSWAVREQKKPIYAYSSRIYDDIAHGVRIVQGYIKVPVGNPGVDENKPEIELETVSARSVPNIEIPNWVLKNSSNYSVENIDKARKAKERKVTYSIKKADVFIAPFENSKVIESIKNISNVNILGKRNGFALIEYSGKRGYVHDKCCEYV